MAQRKSAAQRYLDDIVYLATEIEQIRNDFNESGSILTEDEFAIEWVALHAEEYAHKHNRS